MNILDYVNNVSTKLLKKGNIIFNEREPSNGTMYFVFQGELKVVKNINMVPTEIRTLRPGEFFGEMALISQNRRSASVLVKSEHAKVGMLDQSMFMKLAQTSPTFLFNLLRTILVQLLEKEGNIDGLTEEFLKLGGPGILRIIAEEKEKKKAAGEKEK